MGDPRQQNQPLELVWEELPAGPHSRLDAGAFQIGHLLYCVGGYASQEELVDAVDIFDLDSCQWVGEIAMPVELPRSHFALACEANRYIYFAGGQVGPRCSPATSQAFIWDLHENTWRALPPLPEPRYAPTMQLFRGRLHLVGGSEADRYTPVKDHLSLAVSCGRTVEDEWRVETPIPRGGMHRSSTVVDDRLYVFGGQEGDFVAVPGDPQFTCDGRTIEHIYGEVYEWNGTGKSWIRLPDMPLQSSHIEYSLAVRDGLVVITGGSHYKDPHMFSIELTDAIQVFDTRNQRWTVAGNLPFRVKTCLTAIYYDWIYITAGQRDNGFSDPTPGAVERRTFRAQFFV